MTSSPTDDMPPPPPPQQHLPRKGSSMLRLNNHPSTQIGYNNNHADAPLLFVPKNRRKPSTTTNRSDSNNSQMTIPFFHDAESLSNGEETLGNRSTLSVYLPLRFFLSGLQERSFRTQLFVAFGTVAALSLGVVMAVSILTTVQAGNTVVRVAAQNFDDWGSHKLGDFARVMAHMGIQRLEKLEGMMRLVQTVTQERFMGYPHHLHNDSQVPFANHYSDASSSSNNNNVYPLKAKNPLPLEWQIQPNVFASGSPAEAREHVRDRFQWYFFRNDTLPNASISTMDATFFYQGVCNPHASSSSLSNCTNAHNNISLGGLVNPTPHTLSTIHRKASDFASPLLKALYEYHNEVKSIRIHFFNDGAGATVAFPGRMDSTRTEGSYESMGCEWMLHQTNPHTGRPYATPAQVGRCHPAGTRVSYREFNAFEQQWCRGVLSAPGRNRMHVTDPRNDQDGYWVFQVGQAVHDLVTGELLACVLADVSTNQFLTTDGTLNGITSTLSDYGVIRWQDGKIVNASAWTPDPFHQDLVPISDYVGDYGIDEVLLKEFKEESLENYRRTGKLDIRVRIKNGYSIGVHPVVYPPPTTTTTSASGEDLNFLFLAVYSIRSSERDELVGDVERAVDSRVRLFITMIATAGCVCLGAIVLLIHVMALYFTSPLEWMNRVGSHMLKSAGNFAHLPSEESTRVASGGGGASSSSLEETPSSSSSSKCGPNVADMLQNKPWAYRYSPRTEITKLVHEFSTMVQQFSGEGTAKIIKIDVFETKNPFILQKNFQTLYKRRQQNDFPFRYHPVGQRDNLQRPSPDEGLLPLETCLSGSIVRPLVVAKKQESSLTISEDRRHWGPNSRYMDDHMEEEGWNLHISLKKGSRRRGLLRSSVFWFVAGSMVLPLILCMSAISAGVLIGASRTFPSLIEAVEVVYTSVERLFLLPKTKFGALQVADVLFNHARDLHVFNRLAGWLFFGAIPMADTFTEMYTTAEVCKDYPFKTSCPAIQNTPAATCDCAWKDRVIKNTCQSNYTDSRRLQQLFFEGLREDADPITGHRNSTTYPAVGRFPNDTYFWESIDAVPGAERGYNASGYRTTFDRLRTTSALSAIQIPLYNYVQGTQLQRTWGSILSFDADGMFAGYVGCSTAHTHFAHLQANGDPSVWGNKELCPTGKFGLDGRCLRYNIDAKKSTQSGEYAPLHVTVPRPVAPGTLSFESRALLPLINPSVEGGGEFIGNTIVRFSLQEAWDIIDKTEWDKGFFRIISQSGKLVEPNDVIYLADNPFQPGTPVTTPRTNVSLAQVLLPNDRCDNVFEYSQSCEYLARFHRVVQGVQRGSFGYTQFRRTGADGRQEVVNYNFSPVTLTSLEPVNASDFSRGVRDVPMPIFSVSFGQTEEGIRKSFISVSEEIDKTLRVSLIVMIVIVSITFCLVVYVSWGVALSVSVPVAQLCALVTRINRSELHSDFPQLFGSSREVNQVRNTFERLHMLIKAANTLFFTGQLTQAYQALSDALHLFTTVDNSKAIGIANNNLGNVMLTVYRTMQRASTKRLCGLSQEAVIEKGCAYFKNTIDTGEEAIERINQQEGFTENYLVFMQQLSNRYFNRAVFLLTVRDDHADPAEAERQGMMDLTTCKDMDLEVVDNGDREGFKGDKDVHFELLLGRIKGLLLLSKMGYEDEWGIDELLEGARQALVTALQSHDANDDNDDHHQHHHHALFRDLEPAAQMQRLDSVLIEYYLLLASREEEDDKDDEYGYPPPKQCVEKAAEVAVRMLFEDDYVIADAALLAIKALMEWTHLMSSNSSNHDDKTDNDNDDKTDKKHDKEESEFLGGEDPTTVMASLLHYQRMISDTVALSYPPWIP